MKSPRKTYCWNGGSPQTANTASRLWRLPFKSPTKMTSPGKNPGSGAIAWEPHWTVSNSVHNNFNVCSLNLGRLILEPISGISDIEAIRRGWNCWNMNCARDRQSIVVMWKTSEFRKLSLFGKYLRSSFVSRALLYLILVSRWKYIIYNIES